MTTEPPHRAASPISSNPAWLMPAIALCFFATGCAGLIYEIIWNRTLALLMGNTSYALSTLLTIFMGGLALGAFVGGRCKLTGIRSLLVYGLIELGIGIYCLLLPGLISATEPVFAWFYQRFYSSFLVYNLLQFGVVAVLLLPPTTLMGATLPILVEFLTTRLNVLSRTTGLLYAVNAGGAFAGAILAGLVLLPALGKENSYQIAMGINVLVGLAAIGISLTPLAALSSRNSAQEIEAEHEQRTRSKVMAKSTLPANPHLIGRAKILWGFGLCGFAAMVLQIAWTRAVTLAIGSSTYAFTLISGAFILGLSLGSIGLAWMGDRRWSRLALGGLPLVVGLSGLFTVSVLGALPIRITRLLLASDTFAELEIGKFSAVFFVFLPATFCMGGLLPIVCRIIASSRDEAGRSTGDAYASNAVGTIVGSFCGGFLLIPLLGMRGSILASSAIYMLIGAMFLSAAVSAKRPARALVRAAALLVVIAVVAAAPAWDKSVLTSGPYLKYQNYAKHADASDMEIRKSMAQDILDYREGISSTVSVTQGKDGRRNLVIGGKPDAFSYASTQNWLAHLPMMLRPDARRVLVIGLGSGHTLGSVLRYPSVEAVDCVELSPEVVRAARQFFSEFTDNALDDPRVHLIVGDGRQHLAYSQTKYDVIISQPSNPWIAGAASLFTSECFDTMRRRLTPGGMSCIWFQGFRMPVDNYRCLMRTWAATWSHESIWFSNRPGEHLFIGAEMPLAIQWEWVEKSFANPQVGEQMKSIKIPTPQDMLGFLVVVDEALTRAAGAGPINTDDNGRIEFDTPRGMYRDHVESIESLLRTHRSEPSQFVIRQNHNLQASN